MIVRAGSGVDILPQSRDTVIRARGERGRPTAFLASRLPPFAILALVMRNSTVEYWLPNNSGFSRWWLRFDMIKDLLDDVWIDDVGR